MSAGSFDGVLEKDYCPNCKSNNQIDYEGKFTHDRLTDHYFIFATCHLCDKVFMYEYMEKKRNKSEPKARIISPYGFMELELVYRYPTNDAITYDSVSPDVKNSYLEAVRCLNIGASNAAVTMFRRTLQQICKEKGATKRDLRDQIDEIIVPELKDEAHELRLWGNLGAHPDEIVPSVELEDAIQLQEFIDKFLYAFYEYPSKIKKVQDKRKNEPTVYSDKNSEDVLSS